MNKRILLIVAIITICIISLGYGVFIIIKNNNTNSQIMVKEENKQEEEFDFDSLFDNKIHYQNYKFGNEYKLDTSKELIYTIYELNEKKDGKYDINVKLPYINLSSSKVYDINREIITTFGQKVQSLISSIDNRNTLNTIYTVEYTGFLNENILSVVLKCTLKEGNTPQRLIVKAYTYNLSSNEQIPLTTMLEIKDLDKNQISSEIQKTIQENINKNASLSALGYNIYQRDLNSDIYKIENSNNYFLGNNGTIYIIYAYGNNSYTSEKDIVVIK